MIAVKNEKMHQKKVISKNVTEICTFSLLLMFVNLVLLITFFGAFFQNFFNGFEISVKFCVFYIFLDFFGEKFFLVIFDTFFAFSKKKFFVSY